MAKRIRMFAGPNGSGKSTVFEAVRARFNIGIYVNPDDMARQLVSAEGLALSHYALNDLSAREIHAAKRDSSFQQTAKASGAPLSIRYEKGVLRVDRPHALHYEAAFLSNFFRVELLKRGIGFTFETVMSHPSKLDFVRQAKGRGYRTYLYFVCTESAEINKARVARRAALGWHDVPVPKIEARYARSLGLLAEAALLADRCFLYDNSADGKAFRYLLEVEQGKKVRIQTDQLPAWSIRYLLEPLKVR